MVDWRPRCSLQGLIRTPRRLANKHIAICCLSCVCVCIPWVLSHTQGKTMQLPMRALHPPLCHEPLSVLPGLLRPWLPPQRRRAAGRARSSPAASERAPAPPERHRATAASAHLPPRDVGAGHPPRSRGAAVAPLWQHGGPPHLGAPPPARSRRRGARLGVAPAGPPGRRSSSRRDLLRDRDRRSFSAVRPRRPECWAGRRVIAATWRDISFYMRPRRYGSSGEGCGSGQMRSRARCLRVRFCRHRRLLPPLGVWPVDSRENARVSLVVSMCVYAWAQTRVSCAEDSPHRPRCRGGLRVL